MTAKAKVRAIVIAAACVLGAAALQAHAQAQANPQPNDRCMKIASIDEDKLKAALMNYSGKVLGKHVEHWTMSDYENLLANARACDGKPEGFSIKVDARSWEIALTAVAVSNEPINAMSRGIAKAYAKYWTKDDEFPACATFLLWRRDDLWLTNNSAELFGTPFSKMSADDLSLYRRVAQDCEPVMRRILPRWHQNKERSASLATSIVASIDMDASAAKEAVLKLPESLKVTFNGRRVPIAYLRPSTQEVVWRIVELEKDNRVMPTSSMIQISKWAAQVIEKIKEGPDVMYAKAIQKVITEHMFRNAEKLPDLGAASARPNSGQ